jgi:hypothetical protein
MEHTAETVKPPLQLGGIEIQPLFHVEEGKIVLSGPLEGVTKLAKQALVGRMLALPARLDDFHTRH